MKMFLIAFAGMLLATSSVCYASNGSVSLVDSVQRQVNHDIKYVMDAPGVDDWEVATAQGDCEDIALAKRQRLIDLGWDANDLQIIIINKDKPKVVNGRKIYQAHVVLWIKSLNVVLNSGQEVSPYSEPYSKFMSNGHWRKYCDVDNLTPGTMPTSKRCVKINNQ